MAEEHRGVGESAELAEQVRHLARLLAEAQRICADLEARIALLEGGGLDEAEATIDTADDAEAGSPAETVDADSGD